MNIRNTLVMFCLSLGMLWLFGLMIAYKKTVLEEGLIMPSLKSVSFDAIDSMSIEIKDESKPQELLFQQENKRWTFGKNKIRINDEKIKKIFDDIQTAVKNDEEKVPSNAGTDRPRIIVKIKGRVKGAEKTWELKVGKATQEKSIDFVWTSDLNHNVAVGHAQVQELFFTSIDNFRLMTPFTFEEKSVKRLVLKLEGKDKKELELKKTDEDLWQFVLPKYGFADAEGQKPKEPPKKPKKFGEEEEEKEAKATGGVALLLAGIKGLRTNSADLIPMIENVDLAKYGLVDGKEKLRIDVGTTGGKEEVLLVGDTDPLDKKKQFARLKDDLGIFKLSVESLEPILKAVERPEELRSKDILFTKTDKFDLIRLIKNKQEFVLSHPAGKPWSLHTDNKTVRASELAVNKLLGNLTGKEPIQDFAPDNIDAELGLNEPAFTIELFDNARPRDKDAKKEEPKKDDKDAKKDDKFDVDVEPDVLEGKDRPSVWATFKNAKAKTVAPVVAGEEKIVSAVVEDGKVKFTQLADPGKDDKVVEFTVKSDKDEKIVKVTIRKKPAVTLLFGKLLAKKVNDKEVWSVKRIMADGTPEGTVQRFYLTKELVDKIIPTNVYLTYLDTSLPEYSEEKGWYATSFTLDRPHGKGKKETLDLYRTRHEGWMFRNPSAFASENTADGDDVNRAIGQLVRLDAVKWVQKIDTKTDLKQFDLDPPSLIATVVVKKPQPMTEVGIVGLLSGYGLGFDAGVASRAAYLTYKCNGTSTVWLPFVGDLVIEDFPFELGQTVTILFGKESDKDGGVFARFLADEDKDAAAGKEGEAKKDKVDTNNLLFLAPTDLFKELKTKQFHDRGTVVQTTQNILFASELAAGPLGLLARPLVLGPPMLKFDAAAVEKLTIVSRSKELRTFVFANKSFAVDGTPPAELPSFDAKDASKNTATLKVKNGKVAAVEVEPKEYNGVTVEGKDDWVKITVTDKAKKDDKFTIKVKAVGEDTKNFQLTYAYPKLDKPKEPVKLKGQTWENESKGLAGFTLDSDKVSEMVEKLARLDAKILASFAGPRDYQKLGPDHAAAVIKIDLEGGKSITLSIGAKFRGEDRFAFFYAGKEPGADDKTVYIIGSDLVRQIHDGTDYFGKEAVTGAD